MKTPTDRQTNVIKMAALVVLSVCLAGPVSAEALDFDAIDAELDAMFDEVDTELDAQYEAIDQAIQNAYDRFALEIENVWGEEEVVLPTKSIWVDYSDDKNVRRKIDFENGTIEIEHLVTADDDTTEVVAAIQEAAASIVTDDASDLAKKDTVLNYARQDLAEQAIMLEKFVHKKQPPILADVAVDVPVAKEIETLVKDALKDTSAKSGSVTVSVTQLANNKKKITLHVPLTSGYQSTLAGRYRDSVVAQANRQSLPPSLVYAVMETESAFNPRARSGVPAYGLMQLVPRSGAMDAYRHVYGEKVLLDPEYLYDAEQNVELGAAYLNLLFTRYLRAITDDVSRQLCTIAAYNTGAGNVARSFNGTTNVRKAADIINKMSADEVYDHLIEKLPYEETRRYMQKVTKAQKKYASVDEFSNQFKGS